MEKTRKNNTPKTPAKKYTPDALTDFARQNAWLTLQDIIQKNKTLDEAFEARCGRLPTRDKAFAYNLIATTLRYGLALDKLLNKLMTKPFPENSPQHLLLRMGLCQLLLTDGVKDHAAIATTVNLAKAHKLMHLSGVFNGVLRTAQRTYKKADIQTSDTLPPWFSERLQHAYGQTKAADLTKALLKPACLDIRCRKGTPPQGTTKLAGLPDGWRLDENTKAADLHQALAEKAYYIQDNAAQWPAFILAKHLKTEGPLLDVCAAPGGKALQLADLTENFVVGADISASRLRIMAENIAHTPRLQLIQADGFMPPFAPNSFSGILLDAPCTATGTLRRHPEVLYLRQPHDILALQKRQRDLLKATTPLLKKNGVLVYAVCSLFAEEGEDQQDWITKNLPLKPLPLQNCPSVFKENQPTANALRLTPLDGTDGFYIALYQKT